MKRRKITHILIWIHSTVCVDPLERLKQKIKQNPVTNKQTKNRDGSKSFPHQERRKGEAWCWLSGCVVAWDPCSLLINLKKVNVNFKKRLVR